MKHLGLTLECCRPYFIFWMELPGPCASYVRERVAAIFEMHRERHPSHPSLIPQSGPGLGGGAVG